MNLLTRRGEPFEYFEQDEKLDLYSVSQGRKTVYDAYAGIPEETLEAARLRGTILHRRLFFALASLKGACAYPPMLELYRGYCESMDRWIETAKPVPLKLEAKSLNRERGYAGQVDMQVTFEGTHRLFCRKGDCLGDLKTGAPTPTDKMQVIAYDKMEGFKSQQQFLLYLDADGGLPKVVWVAPGERAIHWAAFLNGIALLRWRHCYGH